MNARSIRTKRPPLYHLLAILAGVALLAGCGGKASVQNFPASAGEEQGPCRDDGTCDDGLTCLSNRCVVWEPMDRADTGNGTGSDAGSNGSEDAGDNGLPDLDSVDLGNELEPPVAPSGLGASDGGDVSVELSWTDNSDNEGGFLLERRDPVVSPEFEEIELLDANTESYRDTGVFKGIEYTYRIRAVNNAGSSDYSGEASQLTPVPTLQEDIVPVFQQGCGANNNLCHARNMYYATADRDCRGWLALENAAIGATGYDEDGNPTEQTGCEDRDLYFRLTEIRAWQCSEGDFVSGTADYVIPGDPENSYIWQKMEGTRLCEVSGEPSERMPQSGQISDEDRLLIRQWIANGAPR